MWYWNGYPVRRVWDASGSLRVSAEKNVTVYAGQDVSDEQIFKFLDRHRRFLLTRLRRAEAWEDRFPEVMHCQTVLLFGKERPLTFVRGGEGVFVRNKRGVPRAVEALCGEAFLQRVAQWKERMGVVCGTISFQYAKTLWGTCDAECNLRFNRAAMMLPPELCDYLIVHELAHCNFRNHGEDFHRFVARFLPDERERRRNLANYAFLLSLYRTR